MATYSRQREGGPFAIESHTTHHYDTWNCKFTTTECVSVYADTDQKTHSVRIWFSEEEQNK